MKHRHTTPSSRGPRVPRMPRMRRVAGLTLAAGLIGGLTAGCLSESVPPPTSAAEGVGASTDPRPSASPSGAGASDPFDFTQTGGSSCVSRHGRFITYELVTTERPVTIDALDLPDAVGVQLGDAYVAPRPEGGLPHSGMMRGTEPKPEFQDDVNWAERRPLADTLLDSGEWYVFVVVDIQHDGRLPGVDLTWSDDLTTGISTWPQRLRVRERCA